MSSFTHTLSNHRIACCRNLMVFSKPSMVMNRLNFPSNGSSSTLSKFSLQATAKQPSFEFSRPNASSFEKFYSAFIHKHHSLIKFDTETNRKPFKNVYCYSISNSTSTSVQESNSSESEQSEPSIESNETNVIDVLKERGLIESITSEELRNVASKPKTSPIKVYAGFDPTAESLHLGNLLGIIVLSWFQRFGHIPVALVGGATALVGDPSGKSMERPMMDDATIQKNLSGIKTTLRTILNRNTEAGNTESVFRISGSDQTEPETAQISEIVIVNNYDWWKDISLLTFLRDVGKYARVGSMVAKESVKKRLNSEEGMSYTEFTYQLLQGYDFVHLYKEMGVNVQIGGSDQWGNITAGTELVRKLTNTRTTGSVFGLTWPLLLKSDGSKFGKSEGGAVWLSPKFLSPYKFYQYLFSTPDSDVIKFMKILTFMELSKINEYEAAMSAPDYKPNTAQIRLAEEVTRFVHGEEGLLEAQRVTQALAPGSSTKLDDIAALEAIAEDIPNASLPLDSIIKSTIVDLLVVSSLFPSKGGGRRMIKQGGVYLNNVKIEDENRVIEESDVIGGKMLLIASGKKNKVLIRVSSI